MSSAIDWGAVTGEALGYFKALLRIDTTNPPGNERPAADYLAEILDRERIEYRVVEGASRRANLIARLRGSGASGALLLNGHLDVVPAETSRWRFDPFGAVEADGYLWGRGAIDMKNMVTMSLMTLLLLKRQQVALDRDVIFAAVADEEAGSQHGSLFLVERHPELVRAEYVLGEVGGHTLHMAGARHYPIQVAEKGICWFELTAEGEPGHGSMPHPNSAIMKLSRAIVALGERRLPQHTTDVVAEFVRTLARGARLPHKLLLPMLLDGRTAPKLLALLEKKQADQAAGLNAMLRNTATPTVLAGGRKINVQPGTASVQVDGRTIPGCSKERFLAEVRAVVGDELAIEVLNAHDGVSFSAATPLFAAIRASVERHDPGASVVPYMIPGFTDAFAYARLGATCYGFAPVRLDPDLNFGRLYHGHDERIPIAGFGWGLRVLYETVREFCQARATAARSS